MRRTEQLQGLTTLKLRDTLAGWESGHLSQLEAAEILGVSERALRRWARRFEAGREIGLTDRRLGRRAGLAVPSDRKRRSRVCTAAGAKARPRSTFTNIWRAATVSAGATAGRGVSCKARARSRKPPGAVRTGASVTGEPWRERCCIGTRRKHAWLSGPGDLDLAVTMDDATNEIYPAILAEEEGTMPGFPSLAETIAAKGLFGSFHTDRGSHYFFAPEAGLFRASPWSGIARTKRIVWPGRRNRHINRTKEH